LVTAVPLSRSASRIRRGSAFFVRQQRDAMKRFAKIFAINYASMVLLFTFLLFVVPEVFPGEPMPTGIDRVLDWVAYPVDWFLVVYSFPFHYLFPHVADTLPVPSWISFLICLLVPATLWTLIIIYARRYWRIYHAAA